MARYRYLTREGLGVLGPRNFEIPSDVVERAIHRSHEILDQFSTYEVDVFSLLGMRNLSSFVGEVFAASLRLEMPTALAKNPHQDGYPDLLVLDTQGKQNWDSLQSRRRDKAPFSPFATGGFEIKATCGSVPTPKECAKRGLLKPDLGDSRIHILQGYDWKAHHRETNHLFGLFWDFIESRPAIVAVFYRGDLEHSDWGRIVKPKENGGRTTSVSIMSKPGLRKMYEGWVAIIKEPTDYARFFDRRNGQTLLSTALAVSGRRPDV